MKPDHASKPLAAAASSRRQFVGGLTTGLATAFGTPVLAAEKKASDSKAPTQAAKQDPLEQYPKPPFPKQLQEWPGLTGEMTPRPDHGEQSYEGRGRLQGRKALITGGDSGIGRAVAIAFAREGADVAISYYPTEEPDAKEVVELIQNAGRKAAALPGDIREEAHCKQLVEEAVRALGGLDILVNNAGRQQACESILELTTEAFDATYKTNCYAHSGSPKQRCRIYSPVLRSSLLHRFRLRSHPRIFLTMLQQRQSIPTSPSPFPSS